MKENAYPGKLIVFEGLDGAGKSTQVGLLADFLKNIHHRKVHETAEPTSSLIGGIIRSQIAGDWKSSNECLQLLFSADRLYHLEKEIMPFLEQGITVISDRYFFSTVAYGEATMNDADWLLKINDKIILPDLVYILKISARVGIERIHANRHGIKLFDKEKLLKRVADNYDKLALQFADITVVLNGEQSIKAIASEIQTNIKQRLL